MIDTEYESAIETRRRSHSWLLLLGSPLIVVTGLLAWRTVWEETSLSLCRGPQMIGFALAHGPFAIFLITPLLLMIWLLLMLMLAVLALWRRRRLSGFYWAALSLGIVVLSLVALPGEFWQWMLIDRFAHSPYAVDFMTEDAAEGHMRTLEAYLNHGVAINARGSYGTAANAAAVAGNVEVLKLLRSRGANLNATDSSGMSPLADAMETKRTEAIMYLKHQGALEIRPQKAPTNPADIIVMP